MRIGIIYQYKLYVDIKGNKYRFPPLVVIILNYKLKFYIPLAFYIRIRRYVNVAQEL